METTTRVELHSITQRSYQQQISLNIKNKANKCFMWCILAHLNVINNEHHPYRVSKYFPFEKQLNMDRISFSVLLSDIHCFEKQNNISVNVIGYEKCYYPLYIS